MKYHLGRSIQITRAEMANLKDLGGSFNGKALPVWYDQPIYRNSWSDSAAGDELLALFLITLLELRLQTALGHVLCFVDLLGGHTRCHVVSILSQLLFRTTT